LWKLKYCLISVPKHCSMSAREQNMPSCFRLCSFACNVEVLVTNLRVLTRRYARETTLLERLIEDEPHYVSRAQQGETASSSDGCWLST
jgi:hypothetical protein